MLLQQQMAQYAKDGYVLVSGSIPEETIVDAEAAMWSLLGMHPDDPASWSPFSDSSDGVRANSNQGLIEHFGVQNPALLACCTPTFYTVQSQLAQENPDAFHCQSSHPEAVWTRSVFPVSKNWDYVGPHIDGGHRGFKTFPGSFRVSTITYLTAGGEQGGGTVVWPGSHLKIREVAMQEPDRYGYVDVVRKKWTLD